MRRQRYIERREAALPEGSLAAMKHLPDCTKEQRRMSKE
jgi:hypothetical protein